MQRTAPYTVAALVFATAACWAIHLAVAPEPFDQSSAGAIAIGIVMFAVIAVAGLVLSRGRWSRNLAIVVTGASLSLGVVLEPDPWYVAGLVLGGLALVGLLGPWLDGWIRRLPSAEGPATIPIVLILLSLALVPAVGLASPSGLEFTHGVLAGTGILFGWGYAKAEGWALWGLRIGIPVLAVGSVIQSPWGGAVLIAALAAAITGLAWTSDAYRAVHPLVDRLPGPRVSAPSEPEPPQP
jgi:hypothetical protein